MLCMVPFTYKLYQNVIVTYRMCSSKVKRKITVKFSLLHEPFCSGFDSKKTDTNVEIEKSIKSFISQLLDVIALNMSYIWQTWVQR